MKEQLTSDEVYALGYAYRLLEQCADKNGSRVHFTDIDKQYAAMRPLRGFAEAMQKFGSWRPGTIDDVTNQRIAEMMGYVSLREEMDDDDINAAISSDLKGAWILGYMHAMGDKAPIIRKKGIAVARKAAGLSQKELAQKIGCSQMEISRWETGSVEPTVQNLKKLAEALECSVDRLLPPYDED